MKVTIIALDALEYSLVDKKFKKLRQKEFGKVRLDGFDEISTIPIWTSFITGKMPQEHGVISQQKDNRLTSFSKLVHQKVLGFKKETGFRKLLARMGFGWGRKDIKVQTIFDRIPNSIAISIPAYSRQRYIVPLTHKEILELISRNDTEKVKNHIWRTHEEERKKVKEMLKLDYNLLMAHFWTTDYIGHYFIGDKPFMDYAYTKMDEMIGEFKELVPDGLFLVVSDHGIEPIKKHYGIHSNYGFYSLNEHKRLYNAHITDFADFICKQFSEKLEKKREEQILRNRLKKLGYI